MTRFVLVFSLGMLVGLVDPFGWISWKYIGANLPDMREQSLAKPSPFEKMPSLRHVLKGEHAYVIEEQHAPISPVHLLVISKERYPTALDTPVEVLGEMLELARRAAQKYGIDKSGFRVKMNTNPQGGQTVYHTHMHVQGGTQMTEPLVPYLASRLVHR